MTFKGHFICKSLAVDNLLILRAFPASVLNITALLQVTP